MSEIKVTDQRPRTTSAEIPEELRALKPIEKDPELVAFIAKTLAKFKPKEDK